MPIRGIAEVSGGVGRDPVGVVDLGTDGLVAIAVVSTVNLTLRSPAEQDRLVDGFARYLNTLTGPAQILVRAVPLRLTDHLDALATQAEQLPHPAHSPLPPATTAATWPASPPTAAPTTPHPAGPAHPARTHHRHSLHQTECSASIPTQGHGRGRGRGRSEVGSTHGATAGARPLPGRGRGAGRLLRRLHDATALLAPLDATVTTLTAAQTTELLAEITCPAANTPRPGSGSASLADDAGTADPDWVESSDDWDEMDQGSRSTTGRSLYRIEGPLPGAVRMVATPAAPRSHVGNGRRETSAPRAPARQIR